MDPEVKWHDILLRKLFAKKRRSYMLKWGKTMRSFRCGTQHCLLIDKIVYKYVDLHDRQNFRRTVGLGPYLLFLSLFSSAITEELRSSLWIFKRRWNVVEFIFCKSHNVRCILFFFKAPSSGIWWEYYLPFKTKQELEIF